MTSYRNSKAVVISGPTASGKTSLSVELALALGGEVINSDSMQVYRGMDVGTAKPTPEEQRGIPHHLLDVVDPDEEFNAATYRSLALPLVEDIVSREKVCLVVGGTGLYIKGLLNGLFECPPADMEFRESLRREMETLGTVVLYKRLEKIDPESSSSIHPNDGLRITRALEIFHLTGRPCSELAREHGFGDTPLRALKLCLEVDRERLYDRINKRSIIMVETGLVQETEELLKKGFLPDLKPMKAIGYRHIAKYLQGGWSLEEAVYNLQRDTRRYAKRQLTWFRADPEYIWIGPEDFDIALRKITEFIDRTA